MSPSSLISEIRKYINDRRKRILIMKDRHDWHRLCCSMDIVQDTEDAIIAFENHESIEENIGKRNLLLYGLLQSLFVQQDAVQSIAESLNIPYKRERVLTDIREARNDAIGHPTNRNGKLGKSYCRLIEMSVDKSFFRYTKATPSKDKWDIRTVDIFKLIERQRTIVIEVLCKFIEELKREAMEHKEKFKDTKLSDIFHNSIGYYFEKVCTGTRAKDHNFDLGGNMLSLLIEVVDEFEKALQKRGEFEVGSPASYEIEDVRYVLDKLDKFFKKDRGNNLTDRDAEIFSDHLSNQFEELEAMAKEYDDKYNVAI